MDVGMNPNRNRYAWVALVTAVSSASLMEQAARAGQLPWSAVVAKAVIAASVTQVDTEPVAIFTISTQQPVIGVPFRVDASQSFDRPSAGPIVNYLWNWGDGSDIGSGVTIEHTYTQSGRFTITLTVFDAENPPNSASTSQTVVIASTTPPPGGVNRAPTAALTINPTQAEIGEEVTFDASGSRDADSDPLTYRFNFGDGRETEFTSDAIMSHVYEEAGSYAVRLTVRDDANASADVTTSVLVLGPDAGNREPVALIATGPRTGAAPVTLSFDGRISFDPDGDPLVYEWSFFLDDLPYDEQSGSVVNQLFDQPGSYSVVLEVSDPDGATSTSDSEVITITERGEPVEPPPPAPIPEPEPPPASHTQRPTRACGIGALMPMLACLMGLMGVRRSVRSRE